MRFPILPILLILLMLLMLQKLFRLSIDALRMAVFGIVCEDESNLSVVIFRLRSSCCSNSKLRRRSLLLALDVVSTADHRAFLAEELVVIFASCGQW